MRGWSEGVGGEERNSTASKRQGERFLIKHELAEPVPPTLPTFPGRTLSALFTFIAFPSPRTLFFPIYSAVYTYFLIFVPRLPSPPLLFTSRPFYDRGRVIRRGRPRWEMRVESLVGIKQCGVRGFARGMELRLQSLYARIDRTSRVLKLLFIEN